MTSPAPELADRIRVSMTLCELLGCATAAQLRAIWLALPEPDRRLLRRSKALAHHAWSLIIRDRILNGAA